ncbi:beta-ketoacyl-ACP synthase 3 [Fundicoccus culcitae]|uniref:Beta-ketoacyl-ACP synthase 3 n=1 Tax=Fundicoccus culcitae TaxID=2969821 RepID=A0ABY5P692_9LACT|nr:beta-ketoacyl-ACP synthase 3 [Fundicoccus culcitae]UUX34262.1 beta-ketoacyl-ACP synthase 3 [Fundicoccus culcitae]
MSKIIATGSYLPSNYYSNTDLITKYNIDSSHEWIQQRSGIEGRYLADTDESVGSLAIEASKALLAKVDSDIMAEIRFIVVASMSSFSPTPSLANQVQAAIGATNAWTVDVNAACSGFVMALELANQVSRNYASGYTLVIGAEKMSDILNFEDRSTAVLFGDGAGALLLKNDGEQLTDYQHYLASASDDALSIHLEQTGDNYYLTMLGREVFNFVNRTVISSLSDFIAEHHLSYDYLVCHQANQRLLDLFAKKLKISHDKIPSNIQKVANTSAGSIPILLDQMVTEQLIRLDGTQSIILSGFGGGLSWGHLYFKL